MVDKSDVTLLKELCKLTQEEVNHSMSKFLIKNYDKIERTDKYIIAEGTIPICLVAHMDTVFEAPPEEIYFDSEQNIMWSPQGLGTDDRSGIFAIVKIIQAGYHPSIILTADEELGCLGAKAIVKQIPDCPLENLKAIIQLDRMGEKDAVFYQCDNKAFTKYITSFGFEESFGTYSDISVIAPSWGIAAVNLSCGYLDEHLEVERCKVDWLLATIEKVKKILDNADSMLSYSYVAKKRENFIWPPVTCLHCGKPLGRNRAHIQGEDEFGKYDYWIHNYECTKTLIGTN